MFLTGLALGAPGLPTVGVAAALSAAAAGTFLWLLPRHVATVLLLADPHARQAVGASLAAESALVTGAAGALLALGPALPFIHDRPAALLPALAATALLPAALVCLAGDPGHDRRRLLGGLLTAVCTWGVSTGLMLATHAPLAPLALLLPWCVTIAMAGWVAQPDAPPR